jgi:hypothetical protein
LLIKNTAYLGIDFLHRAFRDILVRRD